MKEYQDKQSIITTLNNIVAFCPVKICFNGKELYNDYDSTVEIEPDVFGEVEPYYTIVPKRLETALEKYEVLVNRIEIIPVDYHHSIVYLQGEKIKKE